MSDKKYWFLQILRWMFTNNDPSCPPRGRGFGQFKYRTDGQMTFILAHSDVQNSDGVW